MTEKGTTYGMSFKDRDQFHVYGLWCKDTNTLKFFHNGKEVMQVTTSVYIEKDLYLILDTEIFT